MVLNNQDRFESAFIVEMTETRHLGVCILFVNERTEQE